MNKNSGQIKMILLWITVIVLGVLAAILLLLNIYEIPLSKQQVDVNIYGDIATWVSGMLTFIAVSVALFELISQQREKKKAELKTLTDVYQRIGIKNNENGDHGNWTFSVDNYSKSSVISWVAQEDKHGFHLCSRCAGPAHPGCLTLDLDDAGWTQKLGQASPDSFFSPALFFVDNNGQAWHRAYDGNISKSSNEIIMKYIKDAHVSLS